MNMIGAAQANPRYNSHNTNKKHQPQSTPASSCKEGETGSGKKKQQQTPANQNQKDEY